MNSFFSLVVLSLALCGLVQGQRGAPRGAGSSIIAEQQREEDFLLVRSRHPPPSQRRLQKKGSTFVGSFNGPDSRTCKGAKRVTLPTPLYASVLHIRVTEILPDEWPSLRVGINNDNESFTILATSTAPVPECAASNAMMPSAFDCENYGRLNNMGWCGEAKQTGDVLTIIFPNGRRTVETIELEGIGRDDFPYAGTITRFDLSSNDRCPDDVDKHFSGICGCGVSDDDTTGDGVPDCVDQCPNDANKTLPGLCGCGVADNDTDGDGTLDCLDGCPNDSSKTVPGLCGCGFAEEDSDQDDIPDCVDNCQSVKNGGQEDTDEDGVGNACDLCPLDPQKSEPGSCGCDKVDEDVDGDGTFDCVDDCPDDSDKTEPGFCGCGFTEEDSDQDGIPDCVDNCVDVENNGQEDSDGDGVGNACDLCPLDLEKSDPGTCGCGESEADADNDGTIDCIQEAEPDECDERGLFNRACK